jgi:hypothetical protein
MIVCGRALRRSYIKYTPKPPRWQGPFLMPRSCRDGDLSREQIATALVFLTILGR